VLFRLYVPKKTADGKRLGYHTRPQLAAQTLARLCGRREGRRSHAVGDSAYGGKGVLPNLPANCDLTSRLTMDARPYDAPPARGKSRKGGRPRKRGARLPTPEAMPAGRRGRLTLDIYGRKDKGRVAGCVARVYAAPQRAMKVVAADPLAGGRKAQAFFSTCPDDAAEAVLTRYAARWSPEVTYHDAKGHLGFEQPRGWTRLAVRRAAPVAMPPYSPAVLWFSRDGHRHCRPPTRPWYLGKREASFADMTATLRRRSVKEEVLSMHLHGRGSRNVVKRLIQAVNQAA
jgi:hypothetical protein